MKKLTYPKMPAKLLRKGAVPAALVAALSAPASIIALEKVEGNILYVYEDTLASNIPTYCAGRTDWTAVPGTRLASDFCKVVNKITFLEYGYEMLACTNWGNLTPSRIVGLTLFGINVGPKSACGSQAVRALNAARDQREILAACRLIAYKPSGAPNWSFSDGKYVPGLFTRRKVEYRFCLGDNV